MATIDEILEEGEEKRQQEEYERQLRQLQEEERRKQGSLRGQIKEYAKEQAKEYAKEEVGKVAKKALKKVGKEGVKKLGAAAAEAGTTAAAGAAEAIGAFLAVAWPWILLVIAIILVLTLILVVVVSVVNFVCNPEGAVGYLASVINWWNGYIPNEVCQAFAGLSFLDFSSNIGSYVTPNPNIEQWEPLIMAAAQANDLPYCFVRAIVEKESAGKPDAIGHDHTQPPPPIQKWSSPDDGKKAFEPDNTHDPFARSAPPIHNLDWDFSHGIGLMQITIFPYSDPLGQIGWINGSTPARQLPDGSGQRYTAAQLLDPGTSINAATAYLKQLYDRNGQSYQAAAGAYNGSGPNGSYAKDAINRMNLCQSEMMP